MPTKALSKPCSTSTNNQVTALLGGFNGFRLNNCAHDKQSTRPLPWPPVPLRLGSKISEGAKVQRICALRLGWVGFSLALCGANSATHNSLSRIRRLHLSVPPPCPAVLHQPGQVDTRQLRAGHTSLVDPTGGHKWQVCSELVTLRHSFLYWKPRPMRHSARIATPI